MLGATALGSLTVPSLIRRLLADEPVRRQEPERPKRNRAEFVKELAKVQHYAGKNIVAKLLGQPDDIRLAPDSTPHPDDEIWCYGTDGHGSFATLGQVCFRSGRVFWKAGGRGQPPASKIIAEDELCAGMRFLHPGPEHAGYNDPLHLIRVANYLRPRGKDKALAIIGEYGRIADLGIGDTWLVLLLQALFDVPTPPGHMPYWALGGTSPRWPKDHARIPRFPIEIVDDIPFSLLWGVTLLGSLMPITKLTEYYQQHLSIRAKDFRPPDDPYPSFKKLLGSDAWKYMAAAENDRRSIDNYTGHTLLQVLALCRTSYDPPEARQPFAYPKTSQFDQFHEAFLKTGSRWDEKLQLYVRKDGTHGEVGHLANIYE